MTLTDPAAAPPADEDEDEDDGDWSELRHVTVKRMDAVGAPANGTEWFFAKQAEQGLFPAGYIRELLAKEQAGTPTSGEVVTMTGSPAAIAAMIHNAALTKADLPTGAKTMPTTRTAASTLGATVTKADDEEPADGMDLTTVLADPDENVPGNAADPGSPSWEATDAATARKWTAVLVRAKNAFTVMSERELLEAVDADPGDAENAWDLEDAACAIDFAIDVLAGFAVDEQAESDLCAEDMQMVGKALSGFDASALDTIEALAPIAKAGRASARSRAAIRTAGALLQQVLKSLPPAPAATQAGQPVATLQEETTVSATAVAEPVVAKAKGDAQVAVYDAEGNLVGTAKPENITPLADATAPGGTDTAADADTAVAAAATPTAPAPAPNPDAAVIPGTSTVASPAPVDDDTVTKALQAGLAPMLTEVLAPIAKQLGDYAGLADVVKGLQERVEYLATMPDDRKSPSLNGATGTPGAVDRDGTMTDQYADLQKAADEATDPVVKRDLQQKVTYAKIRDRFAHE
jgi:hypothetical protein